MTDLEATSKPGWRHVFHRWFVQYNPLYLVSAALVLFGVTKLMQATAGEGGVLGQLSSTLVAELYAWALIASAAVLTRRGLWRPAVMLALLTALYQCDLTLQTERSALLEVPGMLATAAWLISFVAKLRALAWAMQLRLSRSAFAVPVFGAVGVAAIPWICRSMTADNATPIVGVLVLWIVAAGLWTFRRIEPLNAQSAWGRTVMRRSTRVIWSGWTVAVLGHVLFTADQSAGFDPVVLAPVVLALIVRGLRTETQVASWSVLSLAFVAIAAPEHFAVAAVMFATVLCLRAFRTPTVVPQEERSRDPYRFLEEPPAGPTWTLAPAPRDAYVRLLARAWTCLYLAAWFSGWEGGPWPDHVLWLDVTFVTGLMWWTVRCRMPACIVPVVITLGHWVVVDRLIPVPQSALQWSLTTITLGFAMLAAGLGVSVRLRER